MTSAAAAVAAVGLATMLAGPASAATSGVNDLPSVTEAELAASVHDIDPKVSDIRPRVDDVDSRSTDAGETVVSLRSDVRFAFGRAELPPAATAKIRELLADVPKGARLKVYGHTDSVGDAAHNLTLSLARAKAVAAAVSGIRPDLLLDVRGFGETKPVQPNTTSGKDNPSGRAANRRVELRFST